MDCTCRRCDRPLEARFRFCPWCGTAQRSKLVEVFPGHPELEGPGRALRVSLYLGAASAERHVRLSVWDDDRAAAAISLTHDEAGRLGRLLAPAPASAGAERPRRRRLPARP